MKFYGPWNHSGSRQLDLTAKSLRLVALTLALGSAAMLAPTATIAGELGNCAAEYTPGQGGLGCTANDDGGTLDAVNPPPYCLEADGVTFDVSLSYSPGAAASRKDIRAWIALDGGDITETAPLGAASCSASALVIDSIPQITDEESNGDTCGDIDGTITDFGAVVIDTVTLACNPTQAGNIQFNSAITWDTNSAADCFLGSLRDPINISKSQCSAVVSTVPTEFLGRLTIVKEVPPDNSDTTDFDFEWDNDGQAPINGGGFTDPAFPFTLNSTQVAGEEIFARITPDTPAIITVTELPVTDYTLTGISCTGGVSAEINVGLGTAVVTLAYDPEDPLASDAICVFTNGEQVDEPAIGIGKSSNTTVIVEPGTVTYDYIVSNLGNVELTNVLVTDDHIDGAVSCTPGNPIPSIPVDGSVNCTASYAISQPEIDANGSPIAASGFLSNMVTATPDQNTAPAMDDLDLPIVQSPSITVDKTSVTTGLSAPQTVTYDYLVTNTGNVTITGLALSDNNDNDDMSCGSNTLTVAPDAGSTTTCTATHTFTQAELDANGSPVGDSGLLSNTVTASSNEAQDAQDSLDIPITQSASLTVDKSSVTTGLSAPQTVTYDYLVTNTGNVTITGLALSDNNDNDDMSCGSNTLTVAPDAGSTTTCTATHTFTQAELDANGSPVGDSGLLSNTVTASSNEAQDAQDSLDIPITRAPAMTLLKTGVLDDGGDGIANAGDVITYSLLVTNTGNVALNNIVVTDPLPDLSTIVCPTSGNETILTLALGADETCTATYAVKQVNIYAGKVDNTATAVSDETDPVESPESVPLAQSPSIDMVKTADTVEINSEGVVTYSYEVTNTGNVILMGIYIDDDNDEDDASCPETDLAPGASMTCTATHVVTQDELVANGSPVAGSGTLVNNATAYGTPPGAAPVSASDSVSIPFAANVARFMVTKDFTDDNTSGVMVHISCDTGLALTQDFEIFDAVDSMVTFVVHSYIPGTMSCTITEEPVPAGYTGSYEAQAGVDGVTGSITGGPDACVFGEVVGGNFICEITNTLDTVAVDVHKVWEFSNSGNEIPMLANIIIWCDAEIDGGTQDLSSGNYYKAFSGLVGNTTATAHVWPEFPSSSCWAVESGVDSTVESYDNCGDTQQTARMTVSAGNGDECTITNLVFFEGIPTLNQYGLALLALLMLGIGAVGFRRFA